MRINENYRKLEQSYLFSEIAARVAAYTAEHPEADPIRLGIGDVTRPLSRACVEAMESACAEMGTEAGFHGYGPEQGYPFLREAVAEYYAARGIELKPDEVFVSDGAKSDLGNILDLFDRENTVLIPDPVYPVYVDTNIMAGRRIRFAAATEENGFLPMPDGEAADIVYLCSPNNPTGAVYTRAQLEAWVDYALRYKAVLLFDAAYESFVREPGLPRSIYEIPQAHRCAIEFCSFSKMAGFTGTRCGWTVVPQELRFGEDSLHGMWLRRQTTKFNGVPYIVQRGAAAVFSGEGRAQIAENLRYYQQNADVLADTLRQAGVWFTGGHNSPYLWMKCPDGMSGWEFFDRLLRKAGVIGTPGEGFGGNGAGFFRLTAFGNAERTREAATRLRGFFAAINDNAVRC